MNKPGLLLALPRSGTNWSVDVLKAGEGRLLMEPLWLHNGGEYEVNPLHPMRASSALDASETFGHKALEHDPFGTLLTRNLLAWTQEQDGRPHIIKETDGFFHLEWLLQSIPNLRTVLIKRDIRGNIASFKKGGLFYKWDYPTRLRQLLRTIRSDEKLNDLYGDIYTSEAISGDEWVALAYYLGISMLEIRRQITEVDDVLEMQYEEMVQAPVPSFKRIAQYFGIQDIDAILEKARKTTTNTRVESTHSTHKMKDPYDFMTKLSIEEALDIEAVWADLGMPIPKLATRATSSSSNWKRKYETKEPFSNHQVNKRDSLREELVKNSVDLDSEARVSATYVSNRQYAQFLNWLLEKGFPISINGRNVFYNDRPQSKIHIVDQHCVIDSGFENHPATHMNVIGAASFALWLGGRLPKSKELQTVCFNADGTTFESGTTPETVNYGHFQPGTTQVKHYPPSKKGLYDPVGNVSAWCSDTFVAPTGQETQFELVRFGGAWSHSIKECSNPHDAIKGRPWWMAASTLGIRPVFPRKDSLSEQEVILEISRVIEALTDHKLETGTKNRIVYEYINPSL